MIPIHQEDAMEEWPHSKKRLAEINADMASEIIAEIGELLQELPCMHGMPHSKSTPPMFYRENIICIMAMLRKRITELGGEDPFKEIKG